MIDKEIIIESIGDYTRNLSLKSTEEDIKLIGADKSIFYSHKLFYGEETNKELSKEERSQTMNDIICVVRERGYSPRSLLNKILLKFNYIPNKIEFQRNN